MQTLSNSAVLRTDNNGRLFPFLQIGILFVIISVIGLEASPFGPKKNECHLWSLDFEPDEALRRAFVKPPFGKEVSGLQFFMSSKTIILIN